MRISEIIFWNNEPAERSRADHPHDLPSVPFGDALTKLANAFTKDGLVKQFWNLNGSEEQPSGPAPPDAEAELITSATFEPITSSWQAEPVDTETSVGQHRLVPFRQYPGISGD
jgi:hypothetical protein